MRIEKVCLREFPPFADADLDFPIVDSVGKGELHLLVGQNGTGKTRLLSLLAAALGNKNELIARTVGGKPPKCVVIGMLGSRTGIWEASSQRCWWLEPNQSVVPILQNLMSNSGAPSADPIISARMIHPATESFLNDDQSAPTTGLTALAFRGTGRVSDAKIAPMSPVDVGTQSQWLKFDHIAETDPVIGQAMANLKVGAAMESMSAPNGQPGRSMQIATRLESAISRITGRTFYFVVDPTPTVALKVYWGGVPMMLMQLPDGLRSIIGWLVSCVAKMASIHPQHEDPLSLPLILLLDEPETHLHPAWQRKILLAAQAMFPQAQMFVATHSPFVISSANVGWIHVLRADDATGLVRIDPPKECSQGDTWIDVVEDVLGITEWYDPETEELLSQFRQLRQTALNGSPVDRQKVKDLAATIALRSHSLSDMMGRELRQLERQLA